MALLWMLDFVCICAHACVKGVLQQPHPNSDKDLDILLNWICNNGFVNHFKHVIQFYRTIQVTTYLSLHIN